jgi:hypothetical protein
VILDSNLSHELSGEVFHAAIVLENISPTSVQVFGCIPNSNPTTPYEDFYSSQPSARWIHRWGCDADLWE